MEAFLLVEPANRVALLACTPRGCEWVFEPTGTHGGEDGSDASETTTPLFPEEVPVCGLGEGVSLAEIVTRRLAQLERQSRFECGDLLLEVSNCVVQLTKREVLMPKIC